jgi:hypothetical protein
MTVGALFSQIAAFLVPAYLVHLVHRRRHRQLKDEIETLSFRLMFFNALGRTPKANPALVPKGFKPSPVASKVETTKRRRSRWQNDVLYGYSESSSTMTVKLIKERDAEGNLRRQADGNLWGSSLGSGLHAPILDLDVPHTYVPSRTEGHGHLYIHKPVSTKQLSVILAALHRAGLIGDGNIAQFEARGQMFAAATTPESVKAGETPVEIEEPAKKETTTV